MIGIRLLSVLALMLGFAALPAAAEPVNVDEAGVALHGFDPVGYFTDSKPVEGTKDFSAEHQGATYYFASAEHRDLFLASPEKYLPQYGGYCALGVVFQQKIDVDPSLWKLVDGKLYLNSNAGAQTRWLGNPEEMIAKADEIWPDIDTAPAAAPQP